MWHTSEGDRILEGAEAQLLKAGVTALVESVKDEAEAGDFDTGIALFDQLTWSQRLALLELVATHLLKRTQSAPTLTAVNEATIGAIFEHVSFEIDMEIDDDSSADQWRQMVLKASHECLGNPDADAKYDTRNGQDDTWQLPDSASCEDRELWQPLVQMLADRILWDRDYELVEDFMDEPPEKAMMLRQIMGIDEDYFATAAEDLNSEEDVGETLQRLAGLLR